MKGIVALLAVASVLGVASAHDWGWGACPRVDPMENLSVDKFLGLWYVVQQFETTADCLTFNYTRVSETQLKITKGRQFNVIHQAGISHRNEYVGTLDIPDEQNQARMRIKWALNFVGKFDYIVFDTDYTNYAGIYECQPITRLMHRKSAAILSRTVKLDQEYVDRVNRILTSSGVDIDEFNVISRRNCADPSQTDINIRVDEESLKRFFSDTADAIGSVGKKIASGATDIARGITGSNSGNLQESDAEELI